MEVDKDRVVLEVNNVMERSGGQAVVPLPLPGTKTLVHSINIQDAAKTWQLTNGRCDESHNLDIYIYIKDIESTCGLTRP
jgi:hypothetical protein